MAFKVGKNKVGWNNGSGGGGGSFGQIDILYADLLALYNAGTMTIGFYLITDIYGGFALECLSPTSIALNGECIFANPDFQVVGNYSGVLAVTGKAYSGNNYLIWQATQEHNYANGDIVIWNGFHYQVIDSSELTETAPNLNPSAYHILLRSQPNVGYIFETDYAEFDIVNEIVTRRRDKRGNDITFGLHNNINNFQWGNDVVANNTQEGTAFISNLNQAGTFNNNTAGGNVILLLDNTFGGDYENCEFGGNNTITGNVVAGVEFQSCIFKPVVDMDLTGALGSYSNITVDNLSSNFPYTITGIRPLFPMAMPAFPNFIGVVIIAYGGAVTFTNLIGQRNNPYKVQYKPQTGDTSTIQNSHAADGAYCANAVNSVLVGNNGDFAEFLANVAFSNYFQTAGVIH